MINLFPQFQVNRIKEDKIRASHLFSEEHYWLQLNHKEGPIDNLVRHYLTEGEHLGLSPNPVFDVQWYKDQNPDIRAVTNDLFLHYIEYGEREYRSPHPLFDPHHYRHEMGIPIERPLHHYTSMYGPDAASPHLFFKSIPWQSYLDQVSPGKNPLVHLLTDPFAEAALNSVFVGRYYAAQRGERYSSARHNITEFIRLSGSESISPHPDFHATAYLAANEDVRSKGMNPYLHFLYFGRSEGRDPAPRISPPTRGKKLSRIIQGEYRIASVQPTKREGQLPKLPTKSNKETASSINLRYLAAQEDVNCRFRLDQRVTQKAETTDAVLISILMPVYRPPLVLLDRAIRSVLQQSVSNWELCIVDDGSKDKDLEKLLTDYAFFDPRIKIAIAAKNGGISQASNAALSLATGAHVALLDNDDMLTCDAIESVTYALTEDPTLDWLYSDECIIDNNDLSVRLFSKPDWSPTLLLSCMYTGHFSVYRRALIEKVGRFRPEYDFSQDYDLALRIAEATPRIKHLQQYLYGWRMTPGSAAQGDKPFARLTNIAALDDALQRRQYPGSAGALPETNVIMRDRQRSRPRVSIIIPSDDIDNIAVSVESVHMLTSYPDFEIIVVTNSGLIERLTPLYEEGVISYVAYDLPFNFSDKCNKGAAAATGQLLFFYNDDVRVLHRDWIESLVDIAILDTVGAVGPKLLYQDGRIQHAGMVTGVRRLVGTAFHMFASDTSEHSGMAQYPREVSLLCGACLGVKTDVFRRLGGFNSVDTPINHSDVDLCFRIRQLGLSCVYVSTACLSHIGHLSIGATEQAEPSSVLRRDKADIYLLKCWGSEIAYDPFFPPPMRNILYRDSQERFQVYPGTVTPRLRSSRGDALLVSHDLSNSGAPKIIIDLAKLLMDHGVFVCVLSPVDGPARHRLTAMGVNVIVDELALAGNSAVTDFAKNFDFAIANTVVTWRFVLQSKNICPVYWYIHESELVDHFAGLHPDFRNAFHASKAIWVGSHKSGKHLERFDIIDYEIVPYGVAGDSSLEQEPRRSGLGNQTGPMTVGLFGSFEPRKGQDLAVLGVLSIPPVERRSIVLRLFGRVLDQSFHTAVLNIASSDPSVVVGGELTPEEYRMEMAAVDVVLVPSRDDTLPLVSLDALAASKPLVVSKTTGTAEWLEDGESACILDQNSPIELGNILRRLLADASLRSKLGQNGHECFKRSFSWDNFARHVLSLLQDNLSTKADLVEH